MELQLEVRLEEVAESEGAEQKPSEGLEVLEVEILCMHHKVPEHSSLKDYRMAMVAFAFPGEVEEVLTP